MRERLNNEKYEGCGCLADMEKSEDGGMIEKRRFEPPDSTPSIL